MTLPPERIGDKGQRYKIEALGYPQAGWNVIGYADGRRSGCNMARAINVAPSCRGARVTDRRPISREPFIIFRIGESV